MVLFLGTKDQLLMNQRIRAHTHSESVRLMIAWYNRHVIVSLFSCFSTTFNEDTSLGKTRGGALVCPSRQLDPRGVKEQNSTKRRQPMERSIEQEPK